MTDTDSHSLNRSKFERHYFSGSCCRLSVVTLGDKSKPDMLLMHGMRDHALSMLNIAEHFSADYHVYLLDLRGHGRSENSGSYTMAQFIADLYALIKHFDLRRPTVIAHSLGGHILSHFSAIYPDLVSKLILLDGMGPPGMGRPIPDENFIEALQSDVEATLSLKAVGRIMAEENEALDRLMQNNPRLDKSTAELIVEHGVETHPDGGIKWRWDPRMNMVWSTFPGFQMEKIWSMIESSVLIVSGDESPEYWSDLIGSDGVDRVFHDSETTRRVALFKSARHEVIKDAGHMLHYDQPEALCLLIETFLAE